MSIRRLAAMVVLAATAALGLGVVPASTAGAQAADYCNFNVFPTVLPPGGGVINIVGVAPADSVVRVFADGTLVATTASDPVTGAFSVQITLQQTVEIAVSIDDYPATGCGTEGQEVSVAPGASAAARRLSYTGASGVGTEVMLGLVMVALGSILVVLVRRRETVRGRNGE